MKKNTGFTLIEVLVAMIILAAGLLGLAGLQASGLRQNLNASSRSQATALAYDLADRIRANSGQIATYTGPAPALTASCLTNAGCDPQPMANHDMAEWNAALLTMPGGGVGSVVQTAGAGTPCPVPADPGCNDDVYTIYVNWDDDKDGNMNVDRDNDGDVEVNDSLFTLGFTL